MNPLKSINPYLSTPTPHDTPVSLVASQEQRRTDAEIQQFQTDKQRKLNQAGGGVWA